MSHIFRPRFPYETPEELRRSAARFDAGAISPRTSDALADRWIGIADDLRARANALETAHLEEGECLEDGRTNPKFDRPTETHKENP